MLSAIGLGVIAAVLLAVLISVAVLYARRAGLHADALERQLMELRAQFAEYHEEDRKRVGEAADRLEFHLRQDLDRRVNEAVLEGRANAARVQDTLGAQISAAQEHVAQLSGRMRIIAEAVEVVTRKPLEGFPADAGRLETKTEKEVLVLAESLAILRPLAPYPKWRFDAEWNNPDLAFQLRCRVWQYFNDRRLEAPLTVRWHGGTRLCLYLGNDLSRQIFIGGCFDPNEFAFLDRFLRPAMTFIDVGANEGVYTVFAARRAGSQGMVWALEPSRRELERLRRNLELNEQSVRVFPLALADRSGQAELTVAGYGHEGHNTLGEFSYDTTEVERKELIEVARLDDLVGQEPPARIDVMKLDVEGAELRLLHGATETLRRYRPVLLFEVLDSALRHQGASQEELLDYLDALEYSIYMFDRYSGLPSPAVPGVYNDNMIAVPAGTSLPDAVFSPWPEP